MPPWISPPVEPTLPRVIDRNEEIARALSSRDLASDEERVAAIAPAVSSLRERLANLGAALPEGAELPPSGLAPPRG